MNPGLGLGLPWVRVMNPRLRVRVMDPRLGFRL